MEILLFLIYLLTLVRAADIGGKVSYNGYKVIRLEVGDHLPEVNSIIQNLKLSTWNGAAKAYSDVDVVVPQQSLEAFQEASAHIKTHIMHQDLGASIAEEAKYNNYIGMKNDIGSLYRIMAEQIMFSIRWQCKFYLV